MENQTEKKKGGFHLMTKERHREICSLGGKAAHAKGTAHKFTSEEAKIAGARGGNAVRHKRLTLRREERSCTTV